MLPLYSKSKHLVIVQTLNHREIRNSAAVVRTVSTKGSQGLNFFIVPPQYGHTEW